MNPMIAGPQGAEWLIIAVILAVPVLLGITLLVLVLANRRRQD